MRSPLAALSLGLLWLIPAGLARASEAPPSVNVALPPPQQVAQWTQEQEDRYEAQREAERQRAAERTQEMRDRMRDYQQEWREDAQDWRTRQEEQTDRIQDYWEDEYDQYYGDSEERYIDDHPYRYYGDRDSGDDWTFRLRYDDDDLDVDFGSSYPDYRHYPYDHGYYYEQDEYYYGHDDYYYEPRVIDRVYVPYPVPSFGNNNFVQLELVSATRSDVSVVLVGSDGTQQLAFDAFNQAQSVYLAAGTYQVAFVDAMNNRTWLSGYLDLGFSPLIRIEFDQGTGTANLYGDPYAWRGD